MGFGKSTPSIFERTDERGATAVEYAIMVAFIAAVIIAIVTVLGLTVADLFDSIPPF